MVASSPVTVFLLASLLLTTTPLFVRGQTDNWSMFRHDINHSGHSSSLMPHPIQMDSLWTYVVPPSPSRAIYSSPAVVDGKVYFVSRDKRLRCLDADTGSLVWTSSLGNSWDTDYPEQFYIKWDSSPAVIDGSPALVIVGARDGKCYAFDATSGFPVWERTLNGVA